MKRNTHYVENTSFSDQNRLSLIGWGGRRPGQRLGPPRQVMDVQILNEVQTGSRSTGNHRSTGTR
jgi:hypothetical protein